jgi:hypothetical protein
MLETTSSAHGAKWFEPTCALLMAMASAATAWCSYQSSSWGGESADLATQAAKLHRQSNVMHLESRQIEANQTRFFMEAIDAEMAGNDKLARFYTDRFSDELKPAYERWRALDPLENSAAPPTPFDPALYFPRFQQEIREGHDESSRIEERSKAAGHVASKYLNHTVSLATVLVFAATAEKFHQRRVRRASLAFAIALFLYSVVRTAMLPII